MLGLRTRALASMASITSRITARPMAPLLKRNVAVSVAMDSPRASLEPNALDALPRSYTNFAVYKGKAAVQFRLIPPTFKPFITGQPGFQTTGYRLEREGVMFLELANVNTGSGGQDTYGARTYNWAEKITFALTPVELAAFTDVDNLPTTSSVDLYHDPTKGKDTNVKIGKTLKFQAGQSSGYQLMVSQSIGGGPKKTVSVPLTRAELVALKAIAAYAIPRLYGFDYQFEGQGAPYNVVAGDDVYAAEAGSN